MADKYTLMVVCATSGCANDVMNNKRGYSMIRKGVGEIVNKGLSIVASHVSTICEWLELKFLYSNIE